MRVTEAFVKEFEGYGRVAIFPRHGNVRLILRCDSKYGFKASVPFGADYKDVVDSIAKMLPRLVRKVPATQNPFFEPGQTLDFEGGKILIKQLPRPVRHLTATLCKNDITVNAGTNTDFSSRDTVEGISWLIKKSLGCLAPQLLFPIAGEIARRVGVAPAYWKVGRGTTVLGSYHPADGHISLSCVLLLLPGRLREFVICHELAHITYRNHSAEFHRLCDDYCNGNEKALIRELREWKWPILR